ncbi:MAG: hypothetical protein U9O20_03635 [Patescibacteria group bacterium]|nr:hypothetical protein [Patescibacteria group bacterium]
MEEILQKLENQEKKIDEVTSIIKKIRIYFLIILTLSVITFVLPMIGLIFIIPWFMRTIGDTYQGLL